MEPIYQSRYIRDKSTAASLYSYLAFMRPGVIIAYLILIADFFLSLYLWIRSANSAYVIVLFLVPFVFFLRILNYFRVVKVTLNRDLEVNKGIPAQIQVDVTEESVTTSSPFGVNEFAYSSIKKVYRTKNLILLQTKAKLVIVLRTDCFTKGSPEDFKAFLRSKGYKIK